MSYSEQLKHLREPGEQGLQAAARHDLEEHFVSGGVQNVGDESIVQHSVHAKPPHQPPSLQEESTFETLPVSQLEKELEGMARDRDSFVRGVAGLEQFYAEEEDDAE